MTSAIRRDQHDNVVLAAAANDVERVRAALDVLSATHDARHSRRERDSVMLPASSSSSASASWVDVEHEQETALTWACIHGNGTLAQLLLLRGADPSYAPASGRAPLVRAVEFAHAPLVRVLVEHGADVCNPLVLHAAASARFADVLDALLPTGQAAVSMLGAARRATLQTSAQALAKQAERARDHALARALLAWADRVARIGGGEAAAAPPPLERAAAGSGGDLTDTLPLSTDGGALLSYMRRELVAYSHGRPSLPGASHAEPAVLAPQAIRGGRVPLGASSRASSAQHTGSAAFAARRRSLTPTESASSTRPHTSSSSGRPASNPTSRSTSPASASAASGARSSAGRRSVSPYSASSSLSNTRRSASGSHAQRAQSPASLGGVSRGGLATAPVIASRGGAHARAQPPVAAQSTAATTGAASGAARSRSPASVHSAPRRAPSAPGRTRAGAPLSADASRRPPAPPSRAGGVRPVSSSLVLAARSQPLRSGGGAAAAPDAAGSEPNTEREANASESLEDALARLSLANKRRSDALFQRQLQNGTAEVTAIVAERRAAQATRAVTPLRTPPTPLNGGARRVARVDNARLAATLSPGVSLRPTRAQNPTANAALRAHAPPILVADADVAPSSHAVTGPAPVAPVAPAPSPYEARSGGRLADRGAASAGDAGVRRVRVSFSATQYAADSPTQSPETEHAPARAGMDGGSDGADESDGEGGDRSHDDSEQQQGSPEAARPPTDMSEPVVLFNACTWTQVWLPALRAALERCSEDAGVHVDGHADDRLAFSQAALDAGDLPRALAGASVLVDATGGRSWPTREYAVLVATVVALQSAADDPAVANDAAEQADQLTKDPCPDESVAQAHLALRAQALDACGLLHAQRRHFSKAMDYFEAALSLEARLKTRERPLMTRLHMAAVYAATDKYVERRAMMRSRGKLTRGRVAGARRRCAAHRARWSCCRASCPSTRRTRRPGRCSSPRSCRCAPRTS